MIDIFEVFYHDDEFDILWDKTVKKIRNAGKPMVNLDEDTIWMDDSGVSVTDNYLFIRIKNGKHHSLGFISPDEEKDFITKTKIPFWKRRKIRKEFSKMVQEIRLNRKIKQKVDDEFNYRRHQNFLKKQINKIFGEI